MTAKLDNVSRKKKEEKQAEGNKDNVLLSIQNASYQYSDAEGDEYALRDVSYNFEKGKLYAIRGRSGTGKTTLLSLISGLERCTEGKIIFDGKDLKDINLDYYRSHEIGIVFQSYNLLPFMTVSENIILSMDASGIKVDNKKEEALRLMKNVGLKETYATRKVLRISGGEQQRVAIARSLSYNTKMIVADEPTGNLDKQTEKEILEIFEKLAHEEGKCVIIVTHSPNVCEMADQVYDLQKVK
ncbi:MAG: ABC transporter ATP-binding protein [Bacilli bacterium]|nr:ABC transporter ATP-binding protein [Bacilli bacterium]